MEVNSFLVSLSLNNNQPNVFVVYPSKADIESYSLELERDFYERYKTNLKVSYIEYCQYNKDSLDKQDNLYIVDPACYKSIINKMRKTLNNIAKEIQNAR